MFVYIVLVEGRPRYALTEKTSAEGLAEHYRRMGLMAETYLLRVNSAGD